MRIIKVDSISGEVSLINNEILLLEPFSTLNELRKGDFKLLLKELGYAWYVGYYNSPGNQYGYSPVELDKKGRDHVHLNNDWEPCEQLKDVIEYFRINEGLQMKLVRSLRRSFNNVDKVINKLNADLEAQLDNDNMDDTDRSAILGIQKQLLNLSADVPSKMEHLAKVEELALKEEQKLEVARGGKIIQPSML